MRNPTVVLTLTASAVLFISISESRCYGQHYHQPSNHHHGALGHAVDHYGHHIDSFGHHSGSSGVYHGGYYSYPAYSSYPIYYPRIPQSLYSPLVTVTPGPVTYSSPVINSRATTVLKPALPEPADEAEGGEIRIVNPQKTNGGVTYRLNGMAYEMPAGFGQTIQNDTVWVIEFAKIEGGQIVRYRLREGKYRFHRTELGWDLAKVRIAAAAAVDPPPPPVPEPAIVDE